VNKDIILSVKNLTHIINKETKILDNATLHIKKGEFLIITGANGSGKTVLTRHLNGLLKPSSGVVYLHNEPIFNNLINTRTKIGLIFQDANSQFVGQTVFEEVAFGLENLQIPQEAVNQKVREILSLVGLEKKENVHPHVLSGGQKRKLAIAGVLVMEPEVIVLDEPFTGLDYPGVQMVLKQLVDLHKKGHTLVLVTHDLEKVLAHSDRIVVLKGGKIVLEGTGPDIADDLEQHHVQNPFKNGTKKADLTWLN